MMAPAARPAGHKGRTAPSLPLRGFDCIELDLPAATAGEAISALQRLCGARPAVKDAPRLLHDLLVRQGLGSSCLNQTVALPHARTTAVDEILVAVGRSARGIAFDEQYRAIRLVIVVAAPARQVDAYLACTLELARRLREPAVVPGLLAARTEDELRAAWSRPTERT